MAKEAVTLAHGKLIEEVIAEVMTNISGAVTTLRYDVVVVLRFAGVEALVLHVIDRMAEAVVGAHVECLAEPLFDRELQAVVVAETVIAFEIDITVLRIGANGGVLVVEVDVIFAPEINPVIAHKRDLNGGALGNLLRDAQVVLRAVDIGLGGWEAIDVGRDWIAAREEAVVWILEARICRLREREIADNGVLRNVIRPETDRVRLIKNTGTRTNDSAWSRGVSYAEARTEVTIVLGVVLSAGSHEGARGRIVRAGGVELVMRGGLEVPAQPVVDR